jgi:hypothetical protein
MDTLEVLQQARALISDPARWTQGEAALSADGHWVFPPSAQAVRWTLFGALWRVEAQAHVSEMLMDTVVQALVASFDPGDHVYSDTSRLQQYNNTHTHAEVLALFDAAIARLESAAAP